MSSTWYRLRRNKVLRDPTQPYQLESGASDDDDGDDKSGDDCSSSNGAAPFGRASRASSSSKRRSPLPRRQGSFCSEPIVDITTTAMYRGCSDDDERSPKRSGAASSSSGLVKEQQQQRHVTPKDLLAAAFAVQQETIKSLRHTERLLESSMDMGRHTSNQLQQQADMVHHMDAILEEGGEFSRLLKRASNDIRSIARRMMRDKIFLCLCCTVLWMLIVTVILAIRGAITGADLPKFRSTSSG